jgi:nitroreductase
MGTFWNKFRGGEEKFAILRGCVKVRRHSIIMNPATIKSLLESLNWRYATKAFDPAKKIPADVWSALEQTLVLTPTSYGLQPYQFVIVQDPAKRAALLPHSWGQRQVVDCSQFVVFTARTEVVEADIDRFLQRASEVRGVPVAALATYRGMIVGDLVNGPRGKVAAEWAARQSYIALGNLMTAAAVLAVDACPMEGIDPAAYDVELGLAGTGYRTVVACALGYRATGDKYASLAKVRYDLKELIRQI